MNIVFFDIQPQEQRFFKQQFSKDKLTFFKEPIQNVSLSKFKDAECLCVFIHSQVTQQIAQELPKLKLIVTRSTGFDHIKTRAVPVANVPFYGENTVAEHTFGLILSLSRNIHKSYVRTTRNDFSIEGLQGFDLKGKTLGVLGVGHIGLHVIRIAKGFGMHVIAYDIRQDLFISELLHYSYADLDYVIKTADILTLHMPYNQKTHHFLDNNKLSKTKKGVIIINTSRGGLIDTDALYKLLKTGHVAGAGLDVVEGEEFIKDEQELVHNKESEAKLKQIYRNKELFTMDNVIFTPHNAFNSVEAVDRIMQTAAENIVAFKKEGIVKNKVHD